MLRQVASAAGRSVTCWRYQSLCTPRAFLSTLTTRETHPLDAPKAWINTAGDHGWELQRYTPFPDFHLTVYELSHKKTGATYLHADREDSDNAFCVAFRTPPSDSTGIAHILEHLVLCGSERFPVRDPFFFMLKRSLKTFMNAMTAADYTMYPFSTQNEQDYKNLLSVYLDAAFFPLMLESDFRQEGHRFEFTEMKDPSTPLCYKGVVYNEMKGAMSDSNALFAQALSSHLFHVSTYHHNSGGEPTRIPDLTHAQLKAFHATKYHPSNACFFSYGDLPPPLAEVSEHVLKRFTALPDSDLPADVAEPRRVITASEQRVSITSPPDPLVPDVNKQTKIAVAYMCAKSHTHVEDSKSATFDVETVGMELMSTLLLDGPSSPMHEAFVAAGFTPSYAPCTGFDGSTRESVFSVGLQGIASSDADTVLAIVDRTLRRVAVDGFEQKRIDALFHQIELSLKHVTKHFGLNLMMRMMPYFRDRVSVLTPLHVSRQIELIRQRLAEGPFFQKLIEKHILQNKHRVILEMQPDPEFNTKEIAAERAQLDSVHESLDAAAKQRIVDDAVALSARQGEEQESDVLPSLSVSDIDPVAEVVKLSHESAFSAAMAISDPTPIASLVQPTNGVAYVRAISSLAALPSHLLPYLPLFTSYIAATGAGSMSYKELSDTIDLFTGGIGASAQIDSNVDDIDQCNLSFVYSSRALERNIAKMLELSSLLLSDPSFADVERLRVLLSNTALDLSMSLQDTGHTFARLDASQHLTPGRALAEQLSGITSVKFINALVTPDKDDVDGKISDARMLAVGERLQEIAAFVLRGGGSPASPSRGSARRELDRYLITGDEKCLTTLRSALPDFLVPPSHPSPLKSFPVEFTPIASGSLAPRRFFALPIAVNYLAQCVRTVPFTHADSPALSVAAQLMSSIFLHREIRERGGAYGGGCSLDALSGIFSFYSYRDPGCIATIAAFRASVEWISDPNNYTDREVDEALLSIFAMIDAPVAPAQKGVSEFATGITHAMRQSRRDAYLSVTRTDLPRVIAKWMSPAILDASPITCVGNGSAVPPEVSAEGSGWTIDTLSL